MHIGFLYSETLERSTERREKRDVGARNIILDERAVRKPRTSY